MPRGPRKRLTVHQIGPIIQWHGPIILTWRYLGALNTHCRTTILWNSMRTEKIFPSAEHLYQYRKAISLDLPEDADAISLAENPFRAMSLGNNLDAQCAIIHINEWHSTKTKVMRDVIRMKYDSSQDFRNMLENSNDKVLVEATSNMYWASGLNPKSTAKYTHRRMAWRKTSLVTCWWSWEPWKPYRVLKLLSQMQLPLWMTWWLGH